jgi:hypothetical protein
MLPIIPAEKFFSYIIFFKAISYLNPKRNHQNIGKGKNYPPSFGSNCHMTQKGKEG